jgi:hypothetical protein
MKNHRRHPSGIKYQEIKKVVKEQGRITSSFKNMGIFLRVY